VLEARAANKEEVSIESVIQDAAEKFNKSDETIRRSWKRFGRLERRRTSGGS